MFESTLSSNLAEASNDVFADAAAANTLDQTLLTAAGGPIEADPTDPDAGANAVNEDRVALARWRIRSGFYDRLLDEAGGDRPASPGMPGLSGAHALSEVVDRVAAEIKGPPAVARQARAVPACGDGSTGSKAATTPATTPLSIAFAARFRCVADHGVFLGDR